ncbi:hypothetical protein DFH06DRAFT_1307130 [Mycena polygramma]|nr:hypothetical protein DFH06DRAFT_1307130 [Mycena polygramma]
MGSLCFSSASILRCESFTSLESQILIIPTALELIFSTTLIFTHWGTGWRHLLLTAEGWSYFALALLELLSHNIPAVRDNVSLFSIVDIVLGATSFLPIFFYTLFVYLFTRGELIDTLPKRFQRIANILLVFFIPAIVALNEISSFAGISRRTLTVNGRQVVAIGFQSLSDQQIWTFLTSLTLALLTAFQAINFCFAFYRLIRAFIDQRRIETTSTDQAHLIRGIGWITGGLKLGAIETVIGFANGGFGGAMTRRVLRFLARAFLIIGIVKGVDQIDDFEQVQKEMSSGRQQFRRSRLGALISNPRLSTFRQMTPTAGEFHAAPSAAEGKQRERELANTVYANEKGLAPPGMDDFAALKRDMAQLRSPISASSAPNGTHQRVTVHFTQGAPTLHMRFSGLEMPSPAIIAENVKSRPVSPSWVSIARSSRYAPSTAGGAMSPSFAFDPPAMPDNAYTNAKYDTGPVPTLAYTNTHTDEQPQTDRNGNPYPEFIFARAEPPTLHTRAVSDYSMRSSRGYPDSISAVRELAAQFPGPPPVSATRPPMPSPVYGTGWGADLEAYPHQTPFGASATRDSVYSSIRVRAPVPPRAQATLRYGYDDGLEHQSPEDGEPVYRYSYDGPASPTEPEHINHPYAYAVSPPVANEDYSPPDERVDPFHGDNAVPNNAYSAYHAYAAHTEGQARTRHRTGRSDTTLGTTPMTYSSSRFDAESSTPNTDEADEETTTSNQDPFRFDGDADAALVTGASGKAYADEGKAFAFPGPQEHAAYMGDGPAPRPREWAPHQAHARNASEMTRTSAALLQMTQRGDADWAPAGVEFTPSVFAMSSAASSPAPSARNTLKKKSKPAGRRPSLKDLPTGVSADTLASSWLHGPLDDRDVDGGFADDYDLPVGPPSAGGLGHVKSVGRVRALKKATPTPVASKHGLTRGSIYIQPITVPPAAFSSEVQIVQGGSSADSYSSEFRDSDRP